MKVLFFTKSKPFTTIILQRMIESNIEVEGIVVTNKESFQGSPMWQICVDNGVRFFNNSEIYSAISKKLITNIDLVVSFIYGNLIKEPIFKLCKGNAINLHPAPLPEYRGLFAYNHALLNGESQWGVTCHFMSSGFDTGRIIERTMFPIEKESISLVELEHQASLIGSELLWDIILRFRDGKNITAYEQGTGTYYDRNSFEVAKRVTLDMPCSEVERKIRAFWFPPYEGAYVEIDNKRYTLVSKEIMRSLTPPPRGGIAFFSVHLAHYYFSGSVVHSR